MKLRIIAGEFGGRSITAPAGSLTHPMGERVRGSLFNILGDISGKTVLDAFSGSGALGLEALSRGAAYVTFIERDKVAQSIIVGNITTLDVADRAKLVRSSVASWDKTTKHQHFDIILADPPYHDLQLSTVSRLVKYLNPKGLMVLSYPGRESASTVNGVVVVDNRSYGDAALAFYRLVD
ncbi:16S rRNA (guanine(966)-N(2))-methyltransferase RsmD [Candidatus Saccharibacteria bacterium]|nr:16S rRNA (guanine(966)-N(2))-methyltransferase RsmD [Candidatus Saccharibacteria bacterium]